MGSALITNDAVIMGILAAMLAAIFYTHNSANPGWKKFYGIVPSLLLCYFLPSLLNTFGVIDGDNSKLYFVASRYLLPASLVLLILSVDLKKVFGLGPKALIMFFTGTLGIVIGGPIALKVMLTIDPSMAGSGDNALWRGMTTVAGSWIGGGANQTSMKEIFNVGDHMFSAMITVDIIAANIWMAILLFLAGKQRQAAVDHWLGADTSKIDELRETVASYEKQHSTNPSTTGLVLIAGTGLALTGLAHFFADILAPWFSLHHPELQKYSLTSGFFWLIVLVTAFGLIASFTPARKLENVGASKVGTVFLYILIATIGMKMNIMALIETPKLLILGLIWISIHGLLLIIVAKIIKAPLFFLAVGSQANVGGAASAPVVAAAFHPALAPVGILLAVMGYAVGTYGAWFCGLLMQSVAGG